MGKKNRFLLPVIAFIFFTFLFCLPGSALPKEDWFDKVWFDKWVHIGIFTVLVFLWSRALRIGFFKGLLFIVLIAMVYGYVIEIIQYRFIPNRSFDWIDLIADFIGSTLGALVWGRYKKNRPL